MKKTIFTIIMILAPFILTAQESKKRSSLLPEQLNKLLLTESMITRFYVDSVNEVKMVEEIGRAHV